MNSPDITGTNAMLTCKLVSLVRYMLYEFSNILKRIKLLEPVEKMLEPFVYITKEIQLEMHDIRPWCSELLSLDHDDLLSPNYYMTMKVGMECDQRLIAVLSFTKKALAVLNDIEQMSRKLTNWNALQLLQAVRIIRLHAKLDGVVVGLTKVTTNIRAARKTSLQTDGLVFMTDDQPLKLMWEAAVDGLLVLKEHQPGEWRNMYKRVYFWGCGQFEEPLPLDLYFDYAQNAHTCRHVLED